ncbi:hypothetical protein [uncultured Microbacterium sp.]|uniref:hypothetical protein n=1 Tax=uncultured Microbacterium sp. TaxID=191216 RepID=UPI00262F541A|nr:hypothetical protein [uncultured Microbacterium sp.]
MIDYKVSDHWPKDTPDWLPSLVSSLDRRHGLSAVLPLAVIVSEIAEWVQLASGTDAWSPKPNRTSLALDIHQSVRTLGPALRADISAPLAAFEAAFAALIGSPRAVVEQPPGTRSAAVWVDVTTSATALLTALDSDAATRASWDDLVAAAQDRMLVHGNPVSFAVVQSVREYAEFISGTALYSALESFVDGTDPKVALAERTDEFAAMQAGKDAATYWRERVAAEGWPRP